VPKRVVTYLVLGILLAVATGATGALHHLHDDDHGAPADCQTCRFIKAAATAVIVAAVLIVFLNDEKRAIVLAETPTCSRGLGHGFPAGPRAPPGR